VCVRGGNHFGSGAFRELDRIDTDIASGTRCVAGHITSPADDEIFCVWIQVFLPKRGRIDRVEESFQLRHMDLDHLAIHGNRITGRVLNYLLNVWHAHSTIFPFVLLLAHSSQVLLPLDVLACFVSFRRYNRRPRGGSRQ
jgi:hypothetical protein